MLYKGGFVEDEVVVIRNANKKVYKRFKRLASEEDMSSGCAITEAMMDYIKNNAALRLKIVIKYLQELEGFIKAGKKVRWSEQIDEILYG